jgi:hypothetical protein
VHTFKSAEVDLTLNTSNYAMNVVKGKVKVVALEGDSVIAKYVKANNIITDEIHIDRYSILIRDNGLTILETPAASNSGIILKNHLLSYLSSPDIPNAPEYNNTIINKGYADALHNSLIPVIDDINIKVNTNAVTYNNLIEGLTTEHLVK